MFSVLCRSLRCLVINLKSFVVSSYVRDHDSKSFVVSGKRLVFAVFSN